MMKQKELIKKHYILQVERVNFFTNAQKTFYPFQGFGIECGEGWNNILDKLCTKIEKILDSDQQDLKLHFYIIQIKEKFGGLRFYTSCHTDEIEKCIREAENESYKICEYCGKLGKYYSNGWHRTLCDKCEAERNKKFNKINKIGK